MKNLDTWQCVMSKSKYKVENIGVVTASASSYADIIWKIAYSSW